MKKYDTIFIQLSAALKYLINIANKYSQNHNAVHLVLPEIEIILQSTIHLMYMEATLNYVYC